MIDAQAFGWILWCILRTQVPKYPSLARKQGCPRPARTPDNLQPWNPPQHRLATSTVDTLPAPPYFLMVLAQKEQECSVV